MHILLYSFNSLVEWTTYENLGLIDIVGNDLPDYAITLK